MEIDYLLKAIHSDFQVNEVQNLYLNGGDYGVYYLFKVGLRTWECVDIIAKMLNIAVEKISYAGLKDEDGITGQFIAINDKYDESLEYKIENNKKFYIRFIGYQNKAFKIGDLVGNSFHIRVRNLSSAFNLHVKKKIDLKFINYYDTQRFGIPGQRKVTHLVGKHILEKDYKSAFEYLIIGGNVSCKDIERYKNFEKEYFDSLSNRIFNFYLSAYDSYVWNSKVTEILKANNDILYVYEKEGFKYIASRLIEEKRYNRYLPILRHECRNDRDVYVRESLRFMYQTVICSIGEILPDDLYDGKYMLDIAFFLPPGSYATTVIDQLMYQLYYSMAKEEL